MSRTLTIHSQNSCYVIPPSHMAPAGESQQDLEQKVASSTILEGGTYTIKIIKGWYSYSGNQDQGEPLVILWLFGHDNQSFTNLNTGLKVGTTWTTLNGFNDQLQIKVEPNQKVTVCALFFDVDSQTNNRGELEVAITDNFGANKGHLTVKRSKSQDNCWKLKQAQLNQIKQESDNFTTLPPGEYTITIREGEITYWETDAKFQLEPWALIWIKGGKFIPEYPSQDQAAAVSESWCSLNGRQDKDKVTLKVLEETTLFGLFVDTVKEDNQGQIILAIDETPLPLPSPVPIPTPAPVPVPTPVPVPHWLSWDNFPRNPQTDIVCVTPVRTIVRREEEITIIRKVRKVEEVDASPACPVNTTSMSLPQQE